MILNILLVLSKCIKPYLKKNLVETFSIVEDMILYNFIFFIFSFIYYNIIEKNNIKNIYNKININNYLIIILFIILTFFELILSTYLIKNYNIIYIKNLNKGLYLILTPLIGHYLFGNKICKKTILGSILILLGIYILK